MRFVLIAAALFAGDEPQPAELRPTVSVVDYLKADGRASSLEDRRGLFVARFPGETYRGDQVQNMRLLARLVAEREDAARAARDAALSSREAARRAQVRPTVEETYFCPAWVPAEGFGVLGSYGFTVTAESHGSRVADKDFVVAFATPSSVNGATRVTGEVRVFHGDGRDPVQTFRLSEAWFPTVGDPDSPVKFAYAERGTVVELPPGTRVTAEVRLASSVTTTQGTVGLWPCTRRIVLAE